MLHRHEQPGYTNDITASVVDHRAPLKPMIAAFDVDGTLITDHWPEYQPRQPMVQVLKAFHEMGFTIWVWTWGSKAHAAAAIEACDIADYVEWFGEKNFPPSNGRGPIVPDLCFDDWNVNLADRNVWVPPMQEERARARRKFQGEKV